MPAVEKIISGGQTGADPAALDVAIKMSIYAKTKDFMAALLKQRRIIL